MRLVWICAADRDTNPACRFGLDHVCYCHHLTLDQYEDEDNDEDEYEYEDDDEDDYEYEYEDADDLPKQLFDACG